MIHISLSDAIATPNAINACKLKMWKVYRETEGQTDGRQTKCDQNSPHEFSAQVS